MSTITFKDNSKPAFEAVVYGEQGDNVGIRPIRWGQFASMEEAMGWAYRTLVSTKYNDGNYFACKYAEVKTPEADVRIDNKNYKPLYPATPKTTIYEEIAKRFVWSHERARKDGDGTYFIDGRANAGKWCIYVGGVEVLRADTMTGQRDYELRENMVNAFRKAGYSVRTHGHKHFDDQIKFWMNN